MATKLNTIVIRNAALDEIDGGKIVLRGIVDISCLHLLQVDDYQREAMPLTSLGSILDALKNGERLPDIELGMRGQRFKEVEPGVFRLYDPVFIVDGQQRVNGTMHHYTVNPEATVHLGVTIYFDTTTEWERERFRILNTLRQKVSPNVLLRNKRDECRIIAMLYGLSVNDKQFVLHDRVTWMQRAKRGELISARFLSIIVGRLHSHRAPTKRTSIEELVTAFKKAEDMIGVQIMRDNTKAFFELIDECWGVRRVQYREGASYMKGTFLTTLAQFLSDHTDFWKDPDEKRLFVEAPLRRKLAQFPIHDPTVVQLASSGGKSSYMLYMMIRDHVNSGKRTKRLTSRKGELVCLNGGIDEVLAEEEADAA